MTIDFSPYELFARADGRRREGALLRVTFDDGARGFADVHPWPELGDAPLDRQLASLSQGYPEPLAQCSLNLARADAEARAEGRSLFETLTVPPSHASLPFGFTAGDLARVAVKGYDRVKLKEWIFSADEISLLRESGLRFRLDFNARLTGDEVLQLLDEWGDLDWIDWVEDPCPYNGAVWAALQKRVRVAMDFERGEEGFDVRVMKPARDGEIGDGGLTIKEDDNPQLAMHNRPPPHPQPLSPGGERGALAFTSYLDHPVGQLGAAWVAARAVAAGLAIETGGLVTHEAYESTEFSSQLGVQAARLVPPGGNGLGFGRELERLEWRILKT